MVDCQYVEGYFMSWGLEVHFTFKSTFFVYLFFKIDWSILMECQQV